MCKKKRRRKKFARRAKVKKKKKKKLLFLRFFFLLLCARFQGHFLRLRRLLLRLGNRLDDSAIQLGVAIAARIAPGIITVIIITTIIIIVIGRVVIGIRSTVWVYQRRQHQPRSNV